MDKSIGAVIYHEIEEGELKFLLLHYPGTKKDYWGLVKGHVEKGESEIDTLRRETEEETGIKDLKIIPGFRKETHYFFSYRDKTIYKRVVFYTVQTSTNRIQLSHEHIGYAWLSFDKALKQLTFGGPKKVLKKANNYLCQQNSRMKDGGSPTSAI